MENPEEKYKQKQKNSETLTADDLLNHFKTVFGNDRGEAEPAHHEAQTHAQGHAHNQEQAHPYAQTQSDTQPHTTAQDYAQTTPPQHEHGPQPTLHPELDAEITEAELRDAIFHQKNNKSPGIDNLSSELFKISFDIVSPFLLKLYNRLFSNGEYPRCWGRESLFLFSKAEIEMRPKITGG